MYNMIKKETHDIILNIIIILGYNVGKLIIEFIVFKTAEVFVRIPI